MLGIFLCGKNTFNFEQYCLYLKYSYNHNLFKILFSFKSDSMEFKLNKFVLIMAFVIIGLMIVSFLINRYLYNKKIKGIIKHYKGYQKKEDVLNKKNKATTKGWGMNDSPFRERKSGLTWGGGNINGANAKSGTRKSCLK